MFPVYKNNTIVEKPRNKSSKVITKRWFYVIKSVTKFIWLTRQKLKNLTD